MKTKESKKVIEFEGVKLSKEAIDKIFYYQHDAPKKFNEKLNFKNGGANDQIGFINGHIHYLIELSMQDEKTNKDIMFVLWTLNEYVELLEALKCPG